MGSVHAGYCCTLHLPRLVVVCSRGTHYAHAHAAFWTVFFFSFAANLNWVASLVVQLDREMPIGAFVPIELTINLLHPPRGPTVGILKLLCGVHRREQYGPSELVSYLSLPSLPVLLAASSRVVPQTLAITMPSLFLRLRHNLNGTFSSGDVCLCSHIHLLPTDELTPSHHSLIVNGVL